MHLAVYPFIKKLEPDVLLWWSICIFVFWFFVLLTQCESSQMSEFVFVHFAEAHFSHVQVSSQQSKEFVHFKFVKVHLLCCFVQLIEIIFSCASVCF